MLTEPEKLLAAIGQRFGTVHAFCAANPELNRTTVYAVLRGRYKGNAGRQLGRIRAALMAAPADGAADLPGLVELEEVIREAACARCPVTRAGICKRCAPLHLQQAQAVLAFLERRRER